MHIYIIYTIIIFYFTLIIVISHREDAATVDHLAKTRYFEKQF